MCAACCAVLVGCTPSPSAGDDEGGHYFGTTERVGGRDVHTLYLNNIEPEYIDPNLTSESGGSTLVRNMNEGLVMQHPEDLRPVAGIATRWAKSPDNRLFRFYLREDAKWSDGLPIVASHFVDSWRRVLDATTGARMATNMYAIHGGALYHRGRLKVLSEESSLAPLAGDAATPIAKGQAVEVLVRLPARARVALRPDNQLPSIDVGEPSSSDPSTPVTIRALGGAVMCNGEEDRWFEVQSASERGWLPGCALVEADPKVSQDVVVVEHRGATYGRVGDAAPLRAGIVPADVLTNDPSVIGVRAASDHVLEVELSRPTPYFLELVATVTYFPVRLDVIRQHGDRWTRPENIVTSGPYTLDEHKFRYEISFKPNPYHWDYDKLRLHRIVWLAVEDNFATLNLYKTGEIDWIGENVSLPPEFIELLAPYDDYAMATWIGTYWYEFNTSKKPVDDERVRRALNVAVDKQQLVDKVARGGMLPAKHIVPPYAGGGYAELFAAQEKEGKNPFTGPGYDFDPAYGRELLQQAGYHVEKTAEGWETRDFPPLEVLFNSNESHRKIAVALQGMWRTHLGITVQVRNEEWKVMIKSIRDGNFQIARFGWIGDYNHPHTWLDTFLSYSQNNMTRWKSSEFDALLARAAEEGDLDKSIRLYQEAEKVAVSAFSRLPIYFYTKHTMSKPYLRGNWPNAANKHPVKYMWIDPNWQRGGPNTTAYPVAELPPAEPWSN
jgi:oligopeptide transport system substrate-binding protein